VFGTPTFGSTPALFPGTFLQIDGSFSSRSILQALVATV
jgi:hypothetical protein